MSRPTEIIIDVDALKHNCAVARQLSPHSGIVAVIKADAYGHGAQDVARALQTEVAMFAVSSIDEAMELRSDGIQTPILLLEGCFSADELNLACSQHLDVVTHNPEQVADLTKLDPAQHVCVWLKVDSGMHRLGFSPEQAMALLEPLKQSASVHKLVLMTHLSVADEIENTFTLEQLAKFNQVVEQAQAEFGQSVEISIANSAALLGWKETRADWNRPGIMIYGLSPFGFGHPLSQNLKPVMSFKSKVIALRKIQVGESVGYGNTWTAGRPSVIATVAVGYGDGYPRNARSGTPVLVNGQRAQLCGRVSMDMISVDVTAISQLELGADVELWGPSLSADEVAQWANTIGYELVTRMPKRTPRRLADALSTEGVAR